MAGYNQVEDEVRQGNQGYVAKDYSGSRQKNWYEDMVANYIRPATDFLTLGLSELGWQKYDQNLASQGQKVSDILNGVHSGEISAMDAQGQLAGAGLGVNAETEKWLDNMIAAQNTQSARNWEEHMASTDLLRAADQLEQLGLSSSNVIQTGGSATNAVGAAENSKSNMAMERYQQRMALAKQLLSMTSSMASAGVYGHAIGAAKKASGIVSSSAAHSGLQALKAEERSKLMAQEAQRIQAEYDEGKRHW